MRRVVRLIMVLGVGLASGQFLFQGCGGDFGGYYSDDCYGPDGYNWCIPGGGWGEIHTPTVEPWDFTE